MPRLTLLCRTVSVACSLVLLEALETLAVVMDLLEALGMIAAFTLTLFWLRGKDAPLFSHGTVPAPATFRAPPRAGETTGRPPC